MLRKKPQPAVKDFHDIKEAFVMVPWDILKAHISSNAVRVWAVIRGRSFTPGKDSTEPALNVSWPSQARIARESHLDRRQVRRAIEELIQAKLLLCLPFLAFKASLQDQIIHKSKYPVDPRSHVYTWDKRIMRDMVKPKEDVDSGTGVPQVGDQCPVAETTLGDQCPVSEGLVSPTPTGLVSPTLGDQCPVSGGQDDSLTIYSKQSQEEEAQQNKKGDKRPSAAAPPPGKLIPARLKRDIPIDEVLTPGKLFASGARSATEAKESGARAAATPVDSAVQRQPQLPRKRRNWPPEVTEMADFYREAFRHRMGEPYVCTDRDREILQNLMGQLGIDILRERIQLAFQAAQDSWFAKTNFAITAFSTCINDFAKKPKPQSRYANDVKLGGKLL